MTEKQYYPKVSVVIPVYNGANYLKESIDCALSQTYENCEVLVINDGSTDDGATAEIARAYGGRIVYIEKENGGVSSALNLGIERMTGDYFSWLSHDDVYAPTKVADSVAALEKSGHVDGMTIAYTGHNHIDKDSQVLKVFSDQLEEGRYYSADEMLQYVVTHKTLNGCCMLIPAQLLRDAGGFDETLRYAQDLLMWLKLFLSGGGMVFDGKVNVGYRLHAAQTSRVRHDLFDKDMAYIAASISGDLCRDEKGAQYAFQLAKRLSRHGTRRAVDVLKNAAAETGHPFSAAQCLSLKTGFFYSRFRSGLKRIYYKVVLKAKV